MSVDMSDTMKKNKPLPHETEKSMREGHISLQNDIKLGTDGTLTHKDTKIKKLPTDLI